ncbi:MAG: PorV/PorQ family protein [Bacteroidetes bacterium]|nr:PorV/PorQ family protein [Bacteroidota bacterium]MBL0257424.1 PorV/PorQ family protein [Bacteroidota bacterium]MBP6403055.1 PorV/PorQ family protein [Bacteroidia bacterium]MBP6648817.1 PorV/PorQ family protein [Bacteroidia bacterium]
MKNIIGGKKLLAGLLTILLPLISNAGNPDRAGQAGASELLINPWARSSGWGGANSGSVHGLEASFLNVAGIAFTKKTEVIFSHTNFLKGSGININAFGISQKVGEAGVLGLSVMSMDFGDIQVTTFDSPEGGLGEFSPQYINLGLSYAKIFSNSIYGGISVKIVNENISNLAARGVAIDAGIQYMTGTNEDKDNIKFGIALKNVGTPLKFGGDGLSSRAPVSSGVYQLTIEQRSRGFEIPSLVNIGGAYDISLAKEHRLTIAATFTSNSFTNDQYTGGLEYGFKNIFMLRGGFTYEEDLFDDNLRTTIYSGPSAGMSIEVPMGKSGKKFGIDYSFRATNPYDGVHSFGAKFTL